MRLIQGIVPIFFLFVIASCTSKPIQEFEGKHATYLIEGPIELDTTLYGRRDDPHNMYLMKVKNIEKDIFIPTGQTSNIYRVSSCTAIKEINKDSLHTLGGSVDYFSETRRVLEKGMEHELSFYIRAFDFQPDTIFVSFKYYLDSLSNESEHIELKLTSLQ